MRKPGSSNRIGNLAFAHQIQRAIVTRAAVDRRRAVARASLASFGGFTFIELLVALSLFALLAIVLTQSLLVGMAIAGRSNERTAATTLATQVMEHIRGSGNPYATVGTTPVARTSLPLPGPYSGVVDSSGRAFQVSVTPTLNADLTLLTVRVNVYRPADPDGSPFVSITTVLDDK